MNLKDYIVDGKCVIPYGITEIEDDAFLGCTGLKSIEIPNSVKKIGKDAFCKCHINTIVIPDSVTEIGSGAFFDTWLASVKIPNKVTVIEEDTFLNCTSLRSINIPYGVKEIKKRAFYNCERLAAVTIPDSITKIERHAFSNSEYLETVILKTDKQNPTEIESLVKNLLEVFRSYKKKTVTVVVPDGCVDKYRQHPAFEEMELNFIAEGTQNS